MFICDKKVSIPSYLVPVSEESHIGFKEGSNLIGKFGKKEDEEKKGKKIEVKKESRNERVKEEEPKKEGKSEKEGKPKTKRATKKKEIKENDKG